MNVIKQHMQRQMQCRWCNAMKQFTDEWYKAKIRYLRSHLKKIDFHSNVLGDFLKLRNFRLFWRPETRENIFFKYFLRNCPNLNLEFHSCLKAWDWVDQFLKRATEIEKFLFSSRNTRSEERNSRSHLESWKRLLFGDCQVALSDFWRKFTRKQKTI